MKTIAVDIDGVLCELNDTEIPILEHTPIFDNIESVNKLYHYNIINLYTSRDESLRFETMKWLLEHGVLYHNLVMNKLRADYYIDDKSVDFKDLL